MYYFIYETKNLLNNKIYVGAHATLDLNDNYLGSGKNLKRAIKKYGVEHFKRTIIEFCNSESELYLREGEIVTPDFISRPDIYNIMPGGLGSFSYINSLPNQNHLPDQQKFAAKIAGLKHKSRMTTDIEYRINHNLKNSQAQLARWGQGRKGNTKGNTMWISNYIVNKSICICVNLYPEYYDQGWTKGRSFNKYNTDRHLYKKKT